MRSLAPPASRRGGLPPTKLEPSFKLGRRDETEVRILHRSPRYPDSTCAIATGTLAVRSLRRPDARRSPRPRSRHPAGGRRARDRRLLRGAAGVVLRPDDAAAWRSARAPNHAERVMPRSLSPPDAVEPTPLGRAMGEVAFYREHNPGFGPYRRKLREDRGLSLRGSADHVGITFARLQEMETGGRIRMTASPCSPTSPTPTCTRARRCSKPRASACWSPTPSRSTTRQPSPGSCCTLRAVPSVGTSDGPTPSRRSRSASGSSSPDAWRPSSTPAARWPRSWNPRTTGVTRDHAHRLRQHPARRGLPALLRRQAPRGGRARSTCPSPLSSPAAGPARNSVSACTPRWRRAR